MKIIVTKNKMLDKSYVILCATLFCCLFSLQALAGPASPFPYTVQQPDGTTIEIIVRGDESRSWAETTDGYSVVKNPADGVWHYAARDSEGQLVASSVVVDPSGERPLEAARRLAPAMRPVANDEPINIHAPGFTPGTGLPSLAEGSAPVLGNRNLLVVLVEFADTTLSTSVDDWERQLFGTDAGDKSVVNYFADNSQGNLTVTPVPHSQYGSPPGIVRVRLDTNHPDTGKDYDYRIEFAWAEDALSRVAPYIDFSSYDTVNDDYLETSEIVVYFVAAGYEGANVSPDTSPSIWGHAWGLLDPGSVVVNGHSISRFAVSGELNYADVIEPMGIVAHELGHLMLDLPDLYDTSDYTEGLGYFSLMAAGSWGSMGGEYAGTTPVNMDAWSRLHLGWATPATLPGAGQLHTFGPALSVDSIAKLGDSFISTTDYFLVENRTYDGWDRGFNGFLGFFDGGLLVLHVDTTIDGNAYDPDGPLNQHPMVALVEANSSICSPSAINPTKPCRGHETNLFYSPNNTTFTDTSYPAARLYNGESVFQMLTEISAPGTYMTARIKGGNQAPTLNVGQLWVIEAGQSFTTEISASDTNGDVLTLEAIKLPPGSSFDTDTNIFHWATDLGSAGSYSATFRVYDDGTPPKEREETVAVEVEKPSKLVDGGGGCFIERLLQ